MDDQFEYLDELRGAGYSVPEMISPLSLKFDLKISETLAVMAKWVADCAARGM